jgi:uncharacterized SAM-binding protein YcdF (DUF218 family)
MYDFLARLLQPYTLFFLLALVAGGGLWRRCREGRRRLRWLAVPAAALWLVSTPAASFLALWGLERPYPPAAQRPAGAEAIVVLAGGLRPPDDVLPRAEMTEDTLHRCLHAAELYHQGAPCPVLVSGGKVAPDVAGPPPARVMGAFLQQLGVSASDLIVEDASRTTYENAAASRPLLERRGLRRVVLVTDAAHMLRASHCFAGQGVEVVPSACHHQATRFDGWWFALLPSSAAALRFQQAAHEWVGLAWYRLQGRL